MGRDSSGKINFPFQVKNVCYLFPYIQNARMDWIVSQQVAVLNCLKKILPFELRIDTYRAFIVLHFNYCPESWRHCGKTGCAKLEKTMNEPFTL